MKVYHSLVDNDCIDVNSTSMEVYFFIKNLLKEYSLLKWYLHNLSNVTNGNGYDYTFLKIIKIAPFKKIMPELYITKIVFFNSQREDKFIEISLLRHP